VADEPTDRSKQQFGTGKASEPGGPAAPVGPGGAHGPGGPAGPGAPEGPVDQPGAAWGSAPAEAGSASPGGAVDESVTERQESTRDAMDRAQRNPDVGD
jgi:hypothetical protein